jgi:hypothetical protein
MEQDIITKLNSVRVINGTAIRTFLNISNRNFANITSAFKIFLNNIQYNEFNNSINMDIINTNELNIKEKLDFIVNNESVFSIDGQGRVRGKYITLSDIIESKRLRLLRYNNYPEVGLDGEVIYT